MRTQTFANGELGLSIRTKLNSITNWDSAYTYNLYDVTNYSGSVYTSLLDTNLGNIPTGSAFWKNIEGLATSASYASTASLATSASYVSTASYAFTASVANTSSYLTTSSNYIVNQFTASSVVTTWPKVYRALVTQAADTNPPTAVVLENTLGFDIVYTRSQPGFYYASASTSNIFPANKTAVMLAMTSLDTGNGGFASAWRENTDKILLNTHYLSASLDVGGTKVTSTVTPDDIGLTENFFQILIYP